MTKTAADEAAAMTTVAAASAVVLRTTAVHARGHACAYQSLPARQALVAVVLQEPAPSRPQQPSQSFLSYLRRMGLLSLVEASYHLHALGQEAVGQQDRDTAVT